MIVLGITGSIGTGKSTIVQRLKELALPVQEADAVVHDLLAHNQTVINEVAGLFPESLTVGRIDRTKLAEIVFKERPKLQILENIIHPRVYKAFQTFLNYHKSAGTKLVVLEVPLLYEKEYDELCHYILVITCLKQTQRQRVLMRPRMREEYLDVINSLQLPDEEKIRRAHYVLDTEEPKRQVYEKVDLILKDIQERAE